MINKTAIIGLGVIGGSLGMALRGNCPGMVVAGRDLDTETIDRAIGMGALDRALDDHFLEECDLVILASPLAAMPIIAEEIKDHLKAGAIVSDAGSVKGWVMELLERTMPAGVHIIGGHPMAGSEKSGLQAADKFLLENAAYILTPRPDTPPEALQDLSAVLQAIGTRVVIMTAAEHDQAVAKVSHLPHLLSAALMNNLQSAPEFMNLAGGGLRDGTRTASSDPDLWKTILALNDQAVIRELAALRQILDTYLDALGHGDGATLRSNLQSAREMRKNMPSLRPCLEDACDLIAIVPDRPGIIGIVGTLLGQADINIQQLQMVHVRDENEGSIKMTVAGKNAALACEVLKTHGFPSWLLE